MKRLTLSLIATVVALSTSAPAFAKDVIMIQGTLLPAGFCQKATDGTIGVKLDKVTSYAQWLDYFALGADRLLMATDQFKSSNPFASELEIAQYQAGLRRDEARFQRSNISRGQNGKCR